MMSGTFYGIGVGPGDPELLTLKAARILREVDLIYCPASVRREESLAAHIIAPLGLAADKLRRVSLSMSRERQADRDVYERSAAEIGALLGRGASAAWITEGDPLFYSTFLYVREQLCRRAPDARIEIVPGVTSFQAAAARAGVAVAHLDEKVAIVPAAYGLEHLPSLLERFATVFLLKIHACLDQLLETLSRLSFAVRTYYLEHVGTPAERLVTDLATLRGQKLPYFSLVILRRHGESLGLEGSS
jgi:precorrin-2/cobalt-factor-2 C20-methyltransferase